MRVGPITAATIAASLSVAPAARAADVAVSAQAAVTLLGGDETAKELNQMNRGDSPFSGAQLNLLGLAVVDEHTEIFLEVPIDMDSSPSTFLTFLRPLIRLYDIGDQKWLNAQAGKLPTFFGTWGERSNSTENGVVARPLLFYYRTAVRSGVVPQNADYFFQDEIRGEGYEYAQNGSKASYHGVPLIYDACWDLGAEAFGNLHGLEYALAVTRGTVSNTSMGEDNNDALGMGGRLGHQVGSGPLFGLRFGASGGWGPYLDSSVEDDPNFPAGASPNDYKNYALGMDLSYSRGPWQLMSEAARVSYEVPNVYPTLHAVGYYVEGVRTFGPVWSVGARQEGVQFSHITSSTGEVETWDYDLWRSEVTLNIRFRPAARLRLGYQITRFPDYDEHNSELASVQLQVWTR